VMPALPRTPGRRRNCGAGGRQSPPGSFGSSGGTRARLSIALLSRTTSGEKSSSGLAKVKLVDIMAAAGISKSFASQVRAGSFTPPTIRLGPF